MTERVHLAPEAIDAVAHRVVEMLRDEPAPAGRLVDATELAALLGVTRGYVYDNADALGGQRLGDGPRGRLRFDPDTARAAWQQRAPRAEPEPERTAPRRRTTQRAAQLLPVHGLTTERPQHTRRPPNG